MKNYTSTVPVERTVMRIEMALVNGGAVGITKEYFSYRLGAISFQVPAMEGRLIAVRLPADVEAVYNVLLKKLKRTPRKESLNRIGQQAERTAWKLLQDWVEIQMSMVEMQQAELLQVFLPYVWDGKRTFFAHLKEGKFKQLEAPKGTKG